MVRRSEQVTTRTEEIPHEAMHRHEALRLSGRFESAHLALALTRRLMRKFSPVVFVLRRAVHDRWHHPTVSRSVAAQLIPDQPARRPALPAEASLPVT